MGEIKYNYNAYCNDEEGNPLFLSERQKDIWETLNEASMYYVDIKTDPVIQDIQLLNHRSDLDILRLYIYEQISWAENGKDLMNHLRNLQEYIRGRIDDETLESIT